MVIWPHWVSTIADYLNGTPGFTTKLISTQIWSSYWEKSTHSDRSSPWGTWLHKKNYTKLISAQNWSQYNKNRVSAIADYPNRTPKLISTQNWSWSNTKMKVLILTDYSNGTSGFTTKLHQTSLHIKLKSSQYWHTPKKLGKNCDCCPVSFSILRSPGFSGIQVLNCQNCLIIISNATSL